MEQNQKRQISSYLSESQPNLAGVQSLPVTSAVAGAEAGLTTGSAPEIDFNLDVSPGQVVSPEEKKKKCILEI